MNIMPLEATSP